MQALLPRIPEDFGNPWMSNLEEIPLPEPVVWTPQAPGWYVLAGLLLFFIGWLFLSIHQRWRAGAYRRIALRELAEVERLAAVTETRPGALRGISGLLKRVALVAYPRTEVANLSGESWLGFLDGAIGSTDFSRGAGRVLSDLSYDPQAAASMSGSDVNALVKLVRKWIQRHPRAQGGEF